jgi:hypothetical protein
MAGGLLAPVSCGTTAVGETAMGEASETRPECAPPSGRYEVVYSELNGTCGRLPPRVIEAHPHRFTRFRLPCSGEVEHSPDGCQAWFRARCPTPYLGSGFSSEQDSRSTFSRDGKRRSGLLRYSVLRPDGTLHCRSIYDVRARNID